MCVGNVFKILGARTKYNNIALPKVRAKNCNIIVPRVGSVVKACTDVIEPDLTKKIPNKLKAKFIMHKSIAIDKNCPRFLEIAKVWINAVVVSQGINDAFSTGSQNHQPPQPKS